MSLTSVYIPIICVCLFVILTTLIHISDLPICRYDYTHANRMNTPLTAAIGAISMIILGQLRRSLLYSNTDKYSNINMSMLTVNLITVISYIISLIDQNICIDNWGVVTYAANWCSWIITVPLLMYTVLVPEFGRAPSSDDIKAIVSIFLTIATGFSIQFHGIDIYGTIILFVVGLISFLFALYFVYFSIKVSMEKCDKNMTAGHKAFNDEVFRLYLLRDLFVVVIVTMTLSFVVYVLAANSALTPTTALVSYLVIDVVGKGLMTFTVIDAHVPILHAVSEEQEIHFKANSHLRSLVRYMLYETRIPLNALAMSLDYVVSEPSLRTDRSEEDVAASKREAFETMVVATTYLEKALNDYLTMQQIEEGSLLLNHHEVVMRDVWTDVVGQLSSIIAARNVELKLSPLAVFPEIVLADRCYLTRALVNLLNSAITCSKAGSKISIHVSSKVGSCKGGPSSEETTGIFITFSTEHPCKTLDELRCCFEPYSTLLIGDIFGDCFSGLSPVIAKEIIALHNGTVDLSASSNGCLIFNINLNLRRVDDREILRRPLKKNRFRAIQVHAHEKDVVYSRLSKPQQDGNSNRCNSNRSDTHTDVVLTNESSELSWSLRHQAAHADVTPLSCIKEGCTLSEDRGSHSMSAIESRSIVPAKPTTQIIANEVPMSTDSNIKNAFEDVNSRNINATCDPEPPIYEDSCSIASADRGILPERQSWRVMCVDDTPSNLKMLQRLLTQFKVKSLAAVNGLEATLMYQENRDLHLIFMDYTMPVMNGIEATRIIREKGFMGCIIAVTGNAMDDDVQEFLDVGADAVVTKPMKRVKLEAIMNCFLPGATVEDARERLRNSF